MILQIKNLNKSFGTLLAIKDLNLEIKEHIVYGFIGPNGAGKTTTMKLIMGFLASDSGEIVFNGEKIVFGQTNKDIGYLPDVPNFYEYMRPLEYLELCGRISNIADLSNRCNEVLSLVGLDKENRRIKGFSRGMRQRLGIAQALLNKPRLLICDEPTSALDPIGRREILDLLKKIKHETTIIFSTHILSDVEEICDEIGIINEGKIIICGEINSLKKKYNDQKLYIKLNNDSDKPLFMEGLKKIKGITFVDINNETIISLSNIDKDQLAIMDFMVKNNIAVAKMVFKEESLENLFMGVVV